MNIVIDGKSCTCEPGEFLLEVARRNGIYIPTLCNHEGLLGQGCCRVCIVEVVERGWSKTVVSCIYPVLNECEVHTNNEKIKQQRGIILRLLQKRAPQSEIIAALCKAYSAPALDKLNEKDGKCIICGLCVRACSTLGAGAIATVNRGITKEIAPPFNEPPADCIGCGSCARVCPTKAIEYHENETTRTVWEKTFTLVHCASCGAQMGTQEELNFAAEKAGTEPSTLCDACRKKQLALVMADVYSAT
ncbi:(2Fe-2S)-binding protein [Eubacteriales bacterium OttesenSCG-928-K08]|nr:(2Fe-2S)-binding protein [Eubacteriales bacterium OttesenSCG-928-K08]